MKTRDIVYTSLAAAAICAVAPFTIPAGSIPLSLATFVIYIASASFGRKKGTLATLIYVLIGAAGVPVFAGFAGGAGVIAGPTGGYILGYIPCAFLCGAFADMRKNSRLSYAAGMICGTAVLYLLGTLWFSFFAKCSFKEALTVCVIPFLAFDAVKIAAASVISPGLLVRLSILDSKRNSKV